MEEACSCELVESEGVFDRFRCGSSVRFGLMLSDCIEPEKEKP